MPVIAVLIPADTSNPERIPPGLEAFEGRAEIRLTDPELVTFELDCGWVTVGGADPVAYLHKYPKRISMLHIKDFKATGKPATINNPPPAEELGRGTVDFKAIFAAARGARIRHAFVEQESFNMAPMESLRVDAEYMKSLR